MKLNQILISLEEYDSLRDFKANIEKGNTYHKTTYCYGIGNVFESFISQDGMTLEIAKIEEAYSNDIKEKDIRINNIITENADLLQSILYFRSLIQMVRKMSIREFLKWRKVI